jgi:hypothetical protein
VEKLLTLECTLAYPMKLFPSMEISLNFWHCYQNPRFMKTMPKQKQNKNKTRVVQQAK